MNAYCVVLYKPNGSTREVLIFASSALAAEKQANLHDNERVGVVTCVD